MIETYLLFLLSAFVVIMAGTKLSKYGDIIAEATPLGHSIVGGILIAAATSLPELVTSVSSALMDAPDIAIGNVYGSNIFNLMILALVDIFHQQGRFLVHVKSNHILAAMFGILLSAVGAIGLLVAQVSGIDKVIGWISVTSIIIFTIYVFASIIIVRYENKSQRELKEEVKEELYIKGMISEKQVKKGNVSLRRAIVGFILASLVIIWAGINLTKTGDQIAIDTGLGQTFVGTLLIAATTSLPELVASMFAIKIGAYDMAVGSVLGSNIFNMLIITATDAVYFKGSIFSVIEINHAITAMAGILLSSMAVIGLFYRSKRTILSIGWDSVFILTFYLGTVYLLYIS
ncbi:sodium:calcium antiporter [Alkaliphilus hydrothermalis]|uniref:Cation:H+ antiporter n=1 Tax=Alkaliphilus hydrothermalis TaxID=1482730 RepID=A0ABS2NP88_9FIRM|nr:sodium:calcium antiporter [Alkaliphilus hydrothermalis]MBM7614759.1 cation:H+ antiporter [Alkaliphilus hydrothermalis]